MKTVIIKNHTLQL